MNSCMIDKATVKVDTQKFRITLPKFMDLKPKDLVVLIEKKDFIEIWSQEEIKNRLLNLKKLIQSENVSMMDRQNYQYFSDQITAFSNTREVVVSLNWNRITLGKELLEKYQVTDKMVVEGVLDHVRLWEHSKFLEYQQSLLSQDKGVTR